MKPRNTSLIMKVHSQQSDKVQLVSIPDKSTERVKTPYSDNKGTHVGRRLCILA